MFIILNKYFYNAWLSPYDFFEVNRNRYKFGCSKLVSQTQILVKYVIKYLLIKQPPHLLSWNINS